VVIHGVAANAEVDDGATIVSHEPARRVIPKLIAGDRGDADRSHGIEVVCSDVRTYHLGLTTRS
jgi:hypothetical protein